MATLPTAPVPPSVDHEIPVYPHRDSYLATNPERQAEHRRNALLLLLAGGVIEFFLLLIFFGMIRIILGMDNATMWWLTIITFLAVYASSGTFALVHLFLISVPEATAAQTVKMFFRTPREHDYFDGQEVFLTGLWWKGLFWQKKDGLNINLRQFEVTIKEDTPALGKGGPGSGPLVHYEAMVTWQADAHFLPLHVMVDEDVISEIISAIGMDALRAEIASMRAEDVPGNRNTLGDALKAAFSRKGSFSTTLEMLGIIIRRAVLKDAQAEESYQNSLTERERAERTKDMARSFMATDSSMTEADALRLALIQQGIITETTERKIYGLDEATRGLLSVEAIATIIHALKDKGEAN